MAAAAAGAWFLTLFHPPRTQAAPLLIGCFVPALLFILGITPLLGIEVPAGPEAGWNTHWLVSWVFPVHYVELLGPSQYGLLVVLGIIGAYAGRRFALGPERNALRPEPA